MILQLYPPIEVLTPLGSGWCLFIIDYGLNVNTVWIVRLDKNSVVKHIDSNDIYVTENSMLRQEKVKI